MYSSTNNDVSIYDDDSGTIAENLTADGGNGLWVDYDNTSSLAATNCLFTGLATLDSPFVGAYNYTNTPDTNVYQTVGGGSHYLADNSTNRGAGTANIDPALLADIQTKTTWPPIVYSDTNISSLATLSPAVPRDTNSSPDLGYQYDPLDYVFGGCDLHSNLTITTGTAIGWFQENGSYSGEPYAISLENGANLSFNGNATQPCYFANYVMVQGGNGNWTDSGWMGAIMFNGSSTSQEPQLSGDFTKWTLDSDFYNIFRDNIADGAGGFKNCEFYDCNITTYDMQYLNFTNCLFFRVDTAYWDQDYAISLAYENCTFYNGCLFMGRYSYDSGDSSSFWLVENNSFDGTAFDWADNLNADSANTLINYNAYNTNNLSWQTYPYPYPPTYGTNEVVGPNDVMVTNYNWESSWFGDFYLPSDSLLITNGSTNANFLGLYHYTTQTNQTPEGTNIVDIGYHYVATDSDGNPLDSNGDGIPDYLEDPLGNGFPYDGTNWALAILVQPTNQTVMEWSNATFSVSAGGVPPLSYQWFLNGEPLSDEGGVSGSESATLTLSGVMSDQAGEYYVVVSSSFGSITSIIATLIVTPSQNYDTPPLYIMPPYGYWNVTDISDPGQPVNIGELQEPFTEPLYVPGTSSTVPPLNTPWHTNTSVGVAEAYGTTAFGGMYGQGTVFKINTMQAPDGAYPNEMVLCGNVLYGTTAGLGGDISGTVFQVNTGGSGFTNIFSFTNEAASGEGDQPGGAVVLSGNVLYGTTEYGGYSGNSSGYGTIFSMNTNGSGYQTLHSFGQFPGDGAYPCAKLVLSCGILYGTTSGGGADNEGTIFEISTNSNGSGYEILHSFAGQAEHDGASPEAELLLSDGVLYGTTVSGGTNGDYGTVFSFNTNTSGITILHRFSGSDIDGSSPCSGLVLSGDTLYGTTSAGGTNGDYGTVFSINTSGSDFQTLHSFSLGDGAEPLAPLVSNGALYGTTYHGGANDAGTVFSINMDGSGFTTLYSFQDSTDGAYPATALVLSGSTLFGTTSGDSTLAGDPNYGTIFSINTNGTNFTVLDTLSTVGYTVLHNFSGMDGDGANPRSELACSGSAFYGIPTTVYGTTFGGGTNGYGTVFKVNTDGTGFTNLYEFTGGNDGKYPQTGLLIDGNTLYGTTTNSIFKIATDGSDFTRLTNINGASQLILWLSGNKLFGTTSSGGDDNYGSVFSINTDGSGFTNLYSFPGGIGGEFPKSGLELYGVGSFIANGPAAGTLYGTTYSGGASNYGMVFSINTDGSDFTDVHDFGGTSDGAYPVGGLLITNNNIGGNSGTYLFGTTSSGGTNDAGTVFGMAVGGGPNTPVQTLYSFGGVPGAGTQPEGKLALLGQVLCGTTSGGGAYTNGMAFTINANGSDFADIYDFSGGSDGGSPLAGLTLTVADNLVSIWSVDTTINVSAENVTNLIYSIAMDNYDALFVNGTLVNWTSHQGQALWAPYLPMPNLHQGENDIRLVIGGDGDGGKGPGDYFTMAVKSTASGVAFTNNVFGATYSGGSSGNGTIYEITPEGYETNLYSFSGQTDGANPIGDLVLSSNTLYGVTQNGGFANDGAIFSFSIGSTNDVILYSFGTNQMIADGQTPKAGLLLISNTLYGTTYYGGANGNGIIFKINTDGSGYTDLHSFDDTDNNDGANPQAPLLLIGTNLYGTTYSGGSDGDGTIFSICTNGSGYTELYSFTGGQPDGANPQAGLLLFSNTFYGTTYSGGSNYDGTIFSFTIGSTQDAILYSFTNTPDGANPEAGLLLVSNILYGTTYNGGAYGDVSPGGTVFSIGVNGSGYTILQSFGSFDGENPWADLIIQDNSLYGTTSSGGAYGDGNVFGISTNGTGFNDIYDFMNNPDGANPEGGLCSP